MARSLAAMAALLLLLAAFPAQSQRKGLSPPWPSVQCEHFEVIYPEPLGLVARRVVSIAEQASEKLRPPLGHAPRKRVQIVLHDDVDMAKGPTDET